MSPRARSCLLLLLSLCSGPVSAQTPVYKLYGLDFSPFLDGQNPDLGSTVTLAQVQARLQLVAPYTTRIRSFGSTGGLEHIPPVAKSMGLQVAAGAWIGRDLTANAAEIDALVANATAGHVDIAIVGSEVLRRGDVTASQLIAYINEVKARIPANIPVATADTFNALLANPSVVAAGDIVLPNIYPYWMGIPMSASVCAFEAAYESLVDIAGGKTIIVSESGWPSAGNLKGAALPSSDNASTFFLQFVSWARARSIPFFYFDALDETFKTITEREQGAHWGIFDKNGVMKPGMQAVFDGDTVPIDCGGTPELTLTYVPPYAATGGAAWLQGRASKVVPSRHRVAVYIYVPGWGWVIKPYSSEPATTISVSGAWSANIVTGGTDQNATQIAAFLIPATYSPPPLNPASSLPAELFTNSVANAQVSRSQRSVSGRVTNQSLLETDASGVAVTLSGSNGAVTTTAADGRYSFVNLAGGGPDVVTPSNAAGSYVASPANRTIESVSGMATADFTIAATADLSISIDAPTQVATGSPVNVIVTIANAGLGIASNVVVTISLSGGTRSGVTASSSRGTCTIASVISCTTSELDRNATTTITVGLTPTSAATTTVTAGLSAETADPSTGNNSQTTTIESVTPTVSTGGAEAITSMSATLTGTVNPNGLTTTARFDYGPTTAYGAQAEGLPVPGSGTSPIPISAAVTGLACNSQYHLRAVALNGVVNSGADLTFTTAVCPPYTDPTITAAFQVKRAHIAELRSRIDAVRIRRGLAPYSWTDSFLVAGNSAVRAVHITDLRTALAQAYAAGASPPAPSYTDTTIIAAVTRIRAAHITELRSALAAIE